MESAIYEGWVRHRRYLPKANQFKYKVFMMYLDLAELEEVFFPVSALVSTSNGSGQV